MRLAEYSKSETLKDGRCVEIRAQRPEDRHALGEAVERTSPYSLYKRFFTVRTVFTEKQADYFLNIDFENHVALVAVVSSEDGSEIVAGARYIKTAPTKAEIAFLVIDGYQKLGLGRILLRHLIVIARDAGIDEFFAEVLSENRPMMKVFESTPCRMEEKSENGVIHVSLFLSSQ